MSRRRREFKQKVNYYSGKVVRDIDIAAKARRNEPIRQKKKQELNQDIKIRNYVRRKLEEYVEQGYSSEEAAELMVKEKGIAKHFNSYSEKKIDIKEMFKNWVQEPEHSNDGEER